VNIKKTFSLNDEIKNLACQLLLFVFENAHNQKKGDYKKG
jgi:hypothetical protein